MRKHNHYKIIRTASMSLSQIYEYLLSRNARITSVSQRFGFVAADDVTAELISELKDLGAKVMDDYCFAKD